MKKAPRVKKKVPKYAEGTPLNTLDTPTDYQYKPAKGKSNKDASFLDYAKDAGRLVAQNQLSTIGLGGLVKDNYKTELGQKADNIKDKYIEPVQKAGATAALNTVAPGSGTAYNAATSALANGIGAENTQQEGESDIAYAQRMAAQGIDIYDKTKGLQGQEGNIQQGIALANQFLKNGGPVKYQKKSEGGDVKKKVVKPDMIGTDMTNYSNTPTPVTTPTVTPIVNQPINQGTIPVGHYKNVGGKEYFLQYNVDPKAYQNKSDTGYSAVPVGSQQAITKQQYMDLQAKYPKQIVYGNSGDVQNTFKMPYQLKADGGEIEGEGGPKDDKIKAKIKPKSFVVPAENAHLAIKLREKYFGKSKDAKLKQNGGADVKLSDGEHLFTPEEKEFLLKKGVDLEALAPNAEEGNELAGGTTNDGVPREKKKKKAEEFSDLYSDQLDEEENKQAQEIIKNQGNPNAKPPTQEEIDLANEYLSENNSADLNNNLTNATDTRFKKVEDDKGNKGKLPSYVTPENALELGQILYGGSKLIGSKLPVDTLDPNLIRSANQARQDANYGFNPSEKSGLINDIETARLTNIGLAANYAGGDPQKAMANARAATNIYGKSLVDVASADANLQLHKKNYADSLEFKNAGIKRQLFEDKLNAFDKNQNAGAALLSTGIENYLGGRRFDKQMEFNKENNTNNTLSDADLLKWKIANGYK